MKLEINDVEHIAALAHLELTPREKEQYTAELSAVLEYMRLLNEVDTDNVTETTQVTGLEDVFTDDKIQECPSGIKKQIIEAFPEKSGRLLKVKGIFEQEVC